MTQPPPTSPPPPPARARTRAPGRPAAPETFSRRVAITLGVAGALSLLATLLVPLLTDDGAPTRTRAPNAYSFSPVGHHAFIETLRELGVPVLVSRHRSASKVDAARALVIAEPYAYDDDELNDLIVEALGNDAPVVLVLPKWDPDDWDRPSLDELAEVPGLEDIAPLDRASPGLLPPADVVASLDVAWRAAAHHLGLRAPSEPVFAPDDLVRATPTPAWTWTAYVARAADAANAATEPPPLGLTLPRYQGLAGAAFDAMQAVALAAGPDAPHSLLIGAHPAADLWVITDPELFNTLGLGAGDNVLLAYRFLVDHLDVAGLVFDEVVHGFKRPPSIWAELATFPLLIVTFHLVGLLLLALWAAAGRFGKPEPEPPRVAPGKATLISNTATLLALGGHAGYSLREYLRASLRAAARAVALPAHLDDAERLAALTRVARDRGVDVDLDDLTRRVAAVGDTKRDARRAVALARRIYRFRLEMTHGPLRDAPRRP